MKFPPSSSTASATPRPRRGFAGPATSGRARPRLDLPSRSPATGTINIAGSRACSAGPSCPATGSALERGPPDCFLIARLALMLLLGPLQLLDGLAKIHHRLPAVERIGRPPRDSQPPGNPRLHGPQPLHLGFPSPSSSACSGWMPATDRPFPPGPRLWDVSRRNRPGTSPPSRENRRSISYIGYASARSSPCSSFRLGALVVRPGESFAAGGSAFARQLGPASTPPP